MVDGAAAYCLSLNASLLLGVGRRESNRDSPGKSMDAWMNWFKKQGQAVVDAGNPTMPGKLVSKSGVKAITGKKVTGYSVFQAAGMEGAIAIAKTSPQLVSGEIAVYQIMPTM